MTVPGTFAMAPLELATATLVSVAWAAEIVTVSVAAPPCVTLTLAGESCVIVGSEGLTLTVAVAEPPFALAVTDVLPAATPVTGMVT